MEHLRFLRKKSLYLVRCSVTPCRTKFPRSGEKSPTSSAMSRTASTDLIRSADILTFHLSDVILIIIYIPIFIIIDPKTPRREQITAESTTPNRPFRRVFPQWRTQRRKQQSPPRRRVRIFLRCQKSRGMQNKKQSKRKRKDKHRKCRHEHRFILRFELDSVSPGFAPRVFFHPDSHIFSIAEKHSHSA